MYKYLLLTILMVPFASTAQVKQRITTTEVVEAVPDNLSEPQEINGSQSSSAAVQTRPAVAAQPAQPAIQAAPQAKTQPTTVIEDAPLRESRAEALRRSRIEIEQETESKIVERLEQERMKAERERAQKLLGNLEEKKEEAPVVAPPVTQTNPYQYPVYNQPQPAQPAPVQQQVAPAPEVVEATAVATVATKATDEDKKDQKEEAPKFYVSGLGGFSDYPGISNIRGLYSAGFNTGIAFPDRLMIEGSLLFSRYQLEETPYYISSTSSTLPVIKNMNQMNILAGAKYRILESRVSPVGGFLLGYTKRTYEDKQNYYQSNNSIVSHAFDMGFSGGVDVNVTEKFSLVSDLRYMFNLSYDVDSTYQTSFVNPPSGNKSPEEINYFIFTIGARLQF